MEKSIRIYFSSFCSIPSSLPVRQDPSDDHKTLLDKSVDQVICTVLLHLIETNSFLCDHNVSAS